MINHIVLIGRLVRDQVLRYTGGGKAFCTFTLAVERNYTNRQGEREADFIDVITWDSLAENCANYLGKGRLVAVEGKLQIRKNSKGNRTYINSEVIAREVDFLDWPKNKKKDKNTSGTQLNTEHSEDLNGHEDSEIF